MGRLAAPQIEFFPSEAGTGVPVVSCTALAAGQATAADGPAPQAPAPDGGPPPDSAEPEGLAWVSADELQPGAPEVARPADPALVRSVAAVGVVSPVLVRRRGPGDGGKPYELLAGHRRVAAHQAAGAGAAAAPDAPSRGIPAVVVVADDVRAAVLALTDNTGRLAPSAWERAAALGRVDAALEGALGRRPTLDEVLALVPRARGLTAERRTVARHVTPALLRAAGYVDSAGAVDREALRRVPHAALYAAAVAARRGGPPAGVTWLRARRADGAGDLVEGAAGAAPGAPDSVARGTQAAAAPAPALAPARVLADPSLTPRSARPRRGGNAAIATVASADQPFALRLTRPLGTYRPEEARAHAGRLLQAASVLVGVGDARVHAAALPTGGAAVLVTLTAEQWEGGVRTGADVERLAADLARGVAATFAAPLASEGTTTVPPPAGPPAPSA